MYARFVPLVLAAVAVACARPAPMPTRQPDAKPPTIDERIARYNAPLLSKYGMTTGQRLRLYLRLFNKRPDVQVDRHRIGSPAPRKALERVADELPDHVLAFQAEIDGLDWRWSSGAYDGGTLNLKGTKDHGWLPPLERDPEGFAEYLVWDDVMAEAVTLLVTGRQSAYRDARLGFIQEGDQEGMTDMGDVEFYLSEGARLGFAWYWQQGGHGQAGDVATKLYENSLPRDTPRSKLRAELMRRGATEVEATALIAWLGKHVVILLPK